MGPTYAHEAGVAEASLLFDVRPDLPVVLVAEVVTIDVLRAALRTGVKDVVEAPLTISKMEEAFGIVVLAQQPEDDETSRRHKIGKVITIMSPKGGAGKTMTAVNVGLTLANWGVRERAVMLDADPAVR